LDGNLVAESNGASELAVRPATAAISGEPGVSAAIHYTDAFGRESDLTNWLTKQIDEARKNESYRAQSNLEHQGNNVVVGFETLRFCGHDARYAVLISPPDSIPEGASLITRQQWHDIKNHLGSLKLYATFLKKKPPDSQDQAIVEKLLNGINGLIDHLAQIRGGDAK
jgi:hypothetical protein